MEKVLGRPASFGTSYMVNRGDKRTNNRTMLPTRSEKIELLKGAGQLKVLAQNNNEVTLSAHESFILGLSRFPLLQYSI